MPKKNGQMKTYSFSKDTVEKINRLCSIEKRNATNLLEWLVASKIKEVEDGEKRGQSNTTCS